MESDALEKMNKGRNKVLVDKNVVSKPSIISMSGGMHPNVTKKEVKQDSLNLQRFKSFQ